MAVIQPFKAWRYTEEFTHQIGKLLSPPFDVVSPKQRSVLYQNPLNSIHLSVPRGPNPALEAAKTLRKWKKEGIIKQDDTPGIYVYYQYFSLPADPQVYCRKGFICMIEASFWEEKIILPHEDTIPSSVNDRIALLEATQLNASPTHGLYTDPEHQLEALMDKSMEHILYQAEDFQGVRDVLSVITDQAQIQHFIALLADKQIILADGHHRYESSLIYRRKKMQNKADHQGNEGYNYHLIYLSNTESNDLKVLPTHRLVKNIPTYRLESMLENCANYFDIRIEETADDIPEIIAGKLWTFGLLTHNECYTIQLKPEVHQYLNLPIYHSLKKLDVVVLHYFFLDKVIGIDWEAQRNAPEISYENSYSHCLYQVNTTHEAQLALIVNGVSIDQIKQVCYQGHLLPQKTTYFYPKAICGFLFGSIHDDEKF